MTTAPTTDIAEAFFAHARANPDRTAIVHNGTTWNYDRLARLAGLVSRSLEPDVGSVGVLTTRSPQTIAALFGVLAAGSAYCPIDSTFPAVRQETMLAAVGCQVVLGTRPDQTPPSGARLIDMSAEGEPFDDLLVPAAPDDPAYILFTSGSTGTPKPVLTSRRALAESVRSLTELLEVAPSDRVLQFASLNWDTCFEEILPALTTGARLVIDDEAYSGSFPRLLRMVHQERVTVLDLPTAFWHELVNHLMEEQITMPGSVRAVVIGGEAARPNRLADWCALDTHEIRLVNTYGCTETTLVTHAIDLHGPAARRYAQWEDVPIGRAMPHVEEHLGDEGELLIGGPAIALGYQGAPEATRDRFPVLDLGDSSRRYFRTGDVVEPTGDGVLLHRGRVDHQIKVRGIRVDPGEVEAQLASHPDVVEAVAFGAKRADHTMLVAYVVARRHTDSETLADDVLGYLRTRVPRHLVPTRITVVDKLLHTASGKLDRAGLHNLHTRTNQLKEARR